MDININWEKLYKAFSAQICTVNCGTLCAPKNGGVPRCCSNHLHEPVLFTNELNWLRKQTDLWQKKPIRSRQDRIDAENIPDYIKYAYCKGITNCDRRYRSLTCRFFPLEPYFEPGKQFAGLTFIYRAQSECPLIEHLTIKISQKYVDQAIDVWTEIFIAFPDEIECYIHGSRGLRTRMKRLGRKITVFRSTRDG